MQLLLQIPSIPSAVLDWITVIQALGSLAISLLIYLVYRRISDIQNNQSMILNKQSKIMSRQNNILSAEYIPDIYGNLIINEMDGDVFAPDTTNSVNLNLVNNGRGKAKNMALTIFVYRSIKHRENQNDKPVYQRAFGSQLVGNGFSAQAYTTDLRQADPEKSFSDILPADGTPRRFHCEFEVIVSRFFSDTKYIASFSELVDLVNKEWETVDTLAFELFIGYNDDTNQYDYTSICTIIDVPIDTELSLNDAFEAGKVVKVPMSYFLPEGAERGTPDLSDVDIETGEGIYDPGIEELHKES